VASYVTLATCQTNNLAVPRNDINAQQLPSEILLLERSDEETQFYRSNSRRICLLIYRIVGNLDDAQDLTQETFIKAIRMRGQLKELGSAAGWLSRIATNTAIDFLRRSKKHFHSDFCGIAETPASSVENAEQALLRRERWSHLNGGLAILTMRERTALILRDLEELPAELVAFQMNCSMGAVRSHIANARKKFKRYLEGKRPL
jgi:RNA polymerase sigma-70 factor (ECF subfamily)